jgi:hypothetical protein
LRPSADAIAELPIIGTRRPRILIDEAIVARCKRVIKDHLDATPCEAAELIEISKAVEKRCSARIASASGFSRLCDPYKAVRFETVAKALIEGVYLAGTR